MDFQKFCSSSALSRRNFLRSAGIASAAIGLPAFAQQTTGQPTAAGQAAAAGGYGARQRGGDMGEFRPLPPDTVVISSNENPLGPAASALAVMMPAAKKGGRYDKEYTPAVIQTISEQFSLPHGPGKTPYVRLYPGSGGPLDLALMSNISKSTLR